MSFTPTFQTYEALELFRPDCASCPEKVERSGALAAGAEPLLQYFHEDEHGFAAALRGDRLFGVDPLVALATSSKRMVAL